MLKHSVCMNNVVFLLCFLLLLISCSASSKPKNSSSSEEITEHKINSKDSVGGGCDGCELMYIGMPDKITSVDTSAAWNEEGQRLIIKGKILQLNGEMPAVDVILYYWQTDASGYYSKGEGAHKQAERHGHIRGWVKSDDLGNYAIYTIKPAAYPNRDIPAHIHISVKEPSISDEYYIDEFVFDDDLLLTSKKRQNLENRGGSGILKPVLNEGILVAEHDIVLGMNIPNYLD